jgi:GTP-binding protein Era
MSFRAGFVSIIGKPNVGKSTLMNALLGEKISIITPKAQTTRHRILGIYNQPEYQIVFSDTPGIIEPKYKLQGSMMKFVNESLQDADLVMFVTDFNEKNEEPELIERLKVINAPLICIINKIDESDNDGVMKKIDFWRSQVDFKEVVPISASNKFNIDMLLKSVLTYLPEGAPFYETDQVTDKSERFIASEILREKILLRYKEEIPYSVQVEIESFKDEEKLLRISAIIYVMRDSQKQIMIGKGGIAIKNMGIAARRDLEKFFGKQVFLQTFVKVKEGLKEWGYDTDGK